MPPSKMTPADAANAPFIYFENAPAFGFINGVLRVTLEAGSLVFTGDGDEVETGRIVVAHLRMNEQAARALIGALEGALALGREAESDKADQTPVDRTARRSMN